VSFFFIDDDGSAPSVAGSTSDNQAASSSFTCALPGSVAAGDLLIAVTHVGKTSAATINTPAGWTPLQQYAGSGNLRKAAVFYKEAAGGETSIALTADVSCDWIGVTARVTGWSAGLLSIGTVATGSSANPDPPSCAGAWNKGRIVFAITSNLNNSITLSAGPSGFTLVNSASISTGVTSRLAVYRMESFEDTVDPGTSTLSGSATWAANTFMVA